MEVTTHEGRKVLHNISNRFIDRDVYYDEVIVSVEEFKDICDLFFMLDSEENEGDAEFLHNGN